MWFGSLRYGRVVSGLVGLGSVRCGSVVYGKARKITMESREKLEILNTYWREQTARPKIDIKHTDAIKILDEFNHGQRLRIALKTEIGTRLMFVEKEIFEI